MRSRRFLAGVFFAAFPVLPHCAAGGATAHWLFLAEKPACDAAALESQARGVLSERTLERRALRRGLPGLFDGRDLPVSEPALAGIRASGASVRQVSRWLNAVSVDATPAQLEILRAAPFVQRIEPVRRGRVLAETPVTDVREAGDVALRDFYGYASDQLNQIGIPAMHAAGYNGSGVIIGILDTGFYRVHDAFNQPGHVVNVLAEHDFVSHDDNTAPEAADHPDQFVHGTLILGVIGGYLPDVLVGGAYGASFVLAKTEDVSQEVPVEEDNYVAGLEFIEAHGGDMTTSSLGYIDWYSQADLDGVTAVTSIAVNAANDNGLVCVTAAGNEGHDDNPATSHLIAPADALRVLTCGAVDVAGVIAGFSSDGPTADGRVKPEVLARGVGTATVSPWDPHGFVGASGTSLSTPLVACATALLIQAHPTWTVNEIRAALTQTASDYVANGVADPLRVRGFGIINAAAASGFVVCPADFNSDNRVDLADLAVLLADFGSPAGMSFSQGDSDGDGDVDLADLSSVLARFGVVCQ